MSSAPATRDGCWSLTARAAAAWVGFGGHQRLVAAPPSCIRGVCPLVELGVMLGAGGICVLTV